MSVVRYISSLFLIVLGSMDCLTTVIGTLYFGTVELNPLIAGLVSTNLPAFVLVKLTVTVTVGLIFILAERTLVKAINKESQSFRTTQNLLNVALMGIIVFLIVVVANNILVILRTV